ncbi:hypothetical protein Tco_0762273 [Tanacetum coccineum]
MLEEVWDLVEFQMEKGLLGTKWVYKNKKDDRGMDKRHTERNWLHKGTPQEEGIDYCKKQTVIANSTTEVEYVVASSCYGQVLWIQNQLLDYGLDQGKDVWIGMEKLLRMKLEVNAGDSKLMLLGINLLLLRNVNVARHALTTTVESINLLLLLKVNAARHNLQLLVNVNAVEVFLGNQLEGMATHDEIYIAPSHTKKIFGNMKRQGNGFSARETPLFPSMMVQAQQEHGEGSAIPTDPQYTPIITQPLTSQPQKKQKPRKPKRRDTEASQPSGLTTNLAEEAINEENVPTHSNDPLLSEHTKTTKALEIDNLKRRVKKLEKKQRSKTHGLRRLYKVGLSARVISSEDEGLGEEDASKQGRKIHDIDADEDSTLENVHDADMFDTSVLNGEEVFAGQDMAKKEVSTADPVTTAGEVVTTANVEVSTANPTAATITTVELTLAQTLAELKSARPKTRGVVMQEPSESTPTTTTIPSKDKGKGIMVKEPLKMKKKYQVLFNEQEAEEQEELTIKEKSKLFVQLLEKRRKFFAAKRAKEKRNKPPTKAQQRSIMTTYLKNMAGWKPKDLKTKSFANIQDLFDKAMKRVNTFVDMDTELVEGSEIREEESSKRAGNELEQEKLKKQKLDERVEAEVDDAKEAEKLKQCLEIVPDDGDDVTIDATPLSVKIPIVDYKIYQEGKKSFFKIIRVDRKTQMYLAFTKMLKNFDREDLEVLWRIVKARFKKIKPINYMDTFLHLNLKTMFEHNIEDSNWKNQQGLVKVLNWKLFNSCRVHCVTVQTIPYYLLVEKMYPLTKHTLN